MAQRKLRAVLSGRGTESIGFVKIGRDGIPLVVFEVGAQEDGVKTLELRVSDDCARALPALKGLEALDENDRIRGMLSDIFLAGMQYERRKRRSK